MNLTSTFAGRHSMDSPEWYTPSEYVEAAREVMGDIDLDPASDEQANEIVLASQYFTERDNGLSRRWRGRVFLNPPGGLVNEFWCKLIDEAVEAIWIGYSLEQLQSLQRCGADLTPLDFPFCVPHKRIAFVENAARKRRRIAKLKKAGKKVTKKGSPSHSNYICYTGENVLKFFKVFSRFGQVVGE